MIHTMVLQLILLTDTIFCFCFLVHILLLNKSMGVSIV